MRIRLSKQIVKRELFLFAFANIYILVLKFADLKYLYWILVINKEISK